MLKICVLTIFALTSAAANCAAAANEGASGAQFLRIGVGAKAAALGETGAAISGVQGIFYNPAGLAGVTGGEIFASHARWILDTNYSNLAFAARAGGGVYGLAVSYLSNPATYKYDKFGTKLSETYSASDMAVTLGYAHKVAGNTDFGLNAKYISSKLDTEAATALAADLGIRCAAVPGKFEFGIVMQNAGGKLNYINEADPLPLNLKLGGQYTVNLEKARDTKKDVTIFLDVNSMKDSGPYANLGVDLLSVYDRNSYFSLRVGYRTNAGKSSGVSAGLSLDMKTYLVDYAYAPMGDLGDTHRVSLTFKFGANAGGTEQD
ncbi:MAG: PorV/PorQ family protein [Elusimicrobiota bacterium]|nr:PorV/PorQ family protein [Elusimicrobiota bacterium]